VPVEEVEGGVPALALAVLEACNWDMLHLIQSD
jgi:hypothetical protein